MREKTKQRIKEWLIGIVVFGLSVYMILSGYAILRNAEYNRENAEINRKNAEFNRQNAEFTRGMYELMRMQSGDVGDGGG